MAIGRIGSRDSATVIETYRYVASGGETSLSGSDAGGATLNYPLNYEVVFLNGVRLVRGDDYQATTGTSITGLSALNAGDVVEILVFQAVDVANAVTSTYVNSTFVANSLVQNTGLEFADGSASAPSVSNVGDTDTGLFFPADNEVGITTGGTERVRVNSSGNVGIGTTSPAWNLDIVSAQPRIGLTDTDTGVKHRIDGNSTAGDLAIFVDYDSVESDPDFNISIKGTERLKLNSNGLITGTGTSLGAWTSYTPTLSGSTTNPTLGSGSTAEGWYVQVGKIVHAYFRIVFGTSASNGSGLYTISLPITGRGAGYNQIIGHGQIRDAGASVIKQIVLLRNTTTSLKMQYGADTTGNATDIAATSPWIWADSDSISALITYEAA